MTEPAKSDLDRNIEYISTDTPIVGDFDREKYPVLQNAILLKLDGKYEESIVEFDKAEFEYGEMLQIYLNRGVAFDQIGKLRKAESDFTNCLKIDSTYIPALLNRGLIYAHSNQIERALSDFDKAIKFKPTEPASYLNRAVAYRESNKLDLACSDLKKAKSLGISEKYISNMTDKMIIELNCDK
tara:strand:- start:3858 stop:4409 length:552 start_codon:yes stop_codon:yes gene_type:complete